MKARQSRAWKIAGASVAALALLVALFIALFDWNWLRGPIERKAYEKTGRELAIKGDLSVKLAWPSPRVRIEGLTFANPAWAKQPHMLDVGAVEVTFSLPELFRRSYVLSEVKLDRAVVFLEKSADGRKNWLLDLAQQDEQARLRIERLTLEQAQLGYDDPVQKTSIRSQLSSQSLPEAGGAEPGVVFSATGRYKGEAIRLSGSGGPVLALRDEDTPYPIKVAGRIGPTTGSAEGTVTSLLKFVALDLKLQLRGGSLAELYSLFGIALPKTNPYVTSGRLTHGGKTWSYEKFSGRIGNSDIAGTLQFDTGGKRTFMHGELVSKLLDFDDLGPLIGARPGTVAQAKAVPQSAQVLPDVPFNTDRWDSVDADVKLRAASIRRAKEVPVENLLTRIRMKDAVLTLDPLDFGVAAGHLAGLVTLDGRQDPIEARARIKANKLQLPKLLPTLELAKGSVGQIDGEFDLKGKGNSVARMLATSNGKAGLVLPGGQVSNLTMEMAGLDLYEIFKFKMRGDQVIRIRCAVADFGVANGVMQANALVIDTEDTIITGTGSINLDKETLALTLKPLPKDRSPLVLRGPLHLSGTLANPKLNLDSRTIAARGLGALALGFISPLLAVIPLIETGPGRDSDCGRLIQDAKLRPLEARPQLAGKK
jgi:AsmA protein